MDLGQVGPATLEGQCVGSDVDPQGVGHRGDRPSRRAGSRHVGPPRRRALTDIAAEIEDL